MRTVETMALKLALVFLVLVSCTKEEWKKREYECSAVGPHGVYAFWAEQAMTPKLAQEEADGFLKYLIEEKRVPDNCFATCVPYAEDAK